MRGLNHASPNVQQIFGSLQLKNYLLVQKMILKDGRGGKNVFVFHDSKKIRAIMWGLYLVVDQPYTSLGS